MPKGRSDAAAALIPPLRFVNLSHPDDAWNSHNRRAVRYHVAAGVGKTKRKHRRPVVVALELRGQHGQQPSPPSEKQGSLTMSHRSYTNKDLSPGQVSTSAKPGLPIDPHGIVGMNPDGRAMQLLQFMKAESETKYRAFSIIWIRMGMSDATSFRLALASAVIFMDLRRGVPVDKLRQSPETAKYYGEALRLLHQRMEDAADRVSPGVVGTVMGFICHDANFGDWGRWAVHMEGLDQLRKLRGGFDGMDGHIPLLAFWLELVGRCVFDTAPCMPTPLDLPPLQFSRATAPAPLQMVLRQVELVHPGLRPFTDAVGALSSVAATVNRRHRDASFWKDEVGAICLLGPLTHYLLSLPRPSGDVEDQTDDAQLAGETLRLTSLLVLSDLKRRSSLSCADMEPLSRKLIPLAMRPLTDAMGGIVDLHLWSLITCSLLLPSATRIPILPVIWALASARGISTTTAILELAESLLWFETVVEAEKIKLEMQLADRLA